MDSSKRNRTAIFIGCILMILFICSICVLMIYQMLRKDGALFDEKRDPFEILDEYAEWQYTEGETETSLGDIWTTCNFEAGSWLTGNGSFSTDPQAGADNLIERNNRSEHIGHSYFFRHEFELDSEELKSIQSIQGEISFKDAVVVYLNGKTIFTGNIPVGGYQSNLEAGMSQESETIINKNFRITELSALREGKNVLSAEVHQGNDKSGEIYFSFPVFTFSEETVEEPEYDARNIYLTQGNEEDEVLINYISGNDESYRVEYLEEYRYTEESDFAVYGKTEYMGAVYQDGLWTNQAKLKKLKPDMEYVYRIIRVGGKEADKVNKFYTGPVHKTSVGLITLPEMEETLDIREKQNLFRNMISEMLENVPDMKFLVVMADEATDENLEIIINKTDIWKSLPGIYVGKEKENQETLPKTVWGLEGDYLNVQDMTLVVCGDAEGDEKKIKTIKEKNQRAWTILLDTDYEKESEAFSGPEDIIFGRTKDGKLFIHYKTEEERKVITDTAWAIVSNYDDRIDLIYADGKKETITQ